MNIEVSDCKGPLEKLTVQRCKSHTIHEINTEQLSQSFIQILKEGEEFFYDQDGKDIMLDVDFSELSQTPKKQRVDTELKKYFRTKSEEEVVTIDEVDEEEEEVKNESNITLTKVPESQRK